MNNNQIQKQVECPICMEQFTTPKVLPCQHTFCLQCLEGHYRSNCSGNIISCPECRAQHPLPPGGISGFPTNITIQRLLEAMPAPNVQQQQPTAPPIQPTAPPLQPTAPPLQPTATSLQPFRNDNNTAISFQPRFNVGIQGDRMITSEYEHFQHGSNPSELDIVRVASLIDHQRELERNVRSNRNQSPERTNRRTIEESQRNVNYRQNEVETNNRNTQPDNHSDRCTISAIKLASHCEDEYKVAVYLFVKSWFEIFIYSTLIWFVFKRLTERAFKNAFVQIWLLIQTLFFVIWLSVGTFWVFGNYKEMTEKCPLYVQDWNFHFINFALFLTVVDWILAVIFLIFSLYSIFEIYEESDTSNSEETV